MSANKTACNLEPLLEQIRHMLTERLKNFSNEARIVIEKDKTLKLGENNTLEIILKSLKDIPREIILELIRNSSLSNDGKIMLNILYGNPRVAILITPKKTAKEEIFSDELILGDRQLIQQSFPEWPRDDVDVAEED